MRIVIVQENLKNALSTCSRAVSNSNTLAVLGSVLLKTESGLLKICATNLEIGIVQAVRCKVEQEGAVGIPAKVFSEVVSNLPSEPITLETIPEGLRLTAGKFKTVLKTIPAEDFPVVSDELPSHSFRLPAKELFFALERVLFAASTNETQVELCGVYCASRNGQLVFTATDRYRLAESRVVLQKDQNIQDFSIILPARAAAEVLRLVHGADTQAVFGVSENQAVLSVGETVVTSRLVDAQYPEYEAIIPQQFAVTIQASKVEVAAALKSVSVFAKGAAGVSVTYTEDQGLVFVARSQDSGEGEVGVAAVVRGGSDTILFNHKYLLDMLQFLSAEQVVVKLNSPTTPVVFEDPGNKNYTYLVMPIKS
jgi:DNA polymerase-3 subunit beta